MWIGGVEKRIQGLISEEQRSRSWHISPEGGPVTFEKPIQSDTFLLDDLLGIVHEVDRLSLVDLSPCFQEIRGHKREKTEETTNCPGNQANFRRSKARIRFKRGLSQLIRRKQSYLDGKRSYDRLLDSFEEALDALFVDCFSD